MPVATTLHPVATKLAEEETVLHRFPSSISSFQDTEVWGSPVLLTFFFLHTDMTAIYSTVPVRISLTFCYKSKNTWWRDAAITGGCFSQRPAQLQELLPLSHKGLCSLRCFFHDLVAKSSQHPCNWSVFTAEPSFWLSRDSVPFGMFPLT